MNLLYYFVVKLPKLFHDEIALGDQKIYLETKFDEFEHRVNEGEVVHTPLKFDTPVKPGDTLYFHHNVVINGGMPFADYKDHYVVSFDPKVAVNSHAYAYKPKGSDEILPLDGWSILEPAFEEEVEHAMFDVVKLKAKVRTTGVVAAPSQDLEDLGLKVGDTVGFRKNMDYTFKANDKEYFRTRTQDLLYAL
tara:strand:- start:677 stop:1252 length:576 start_codon:yes stop_codon:yes gene_type:complete